MIVALICVGWLALLLGFWIGVQWNSDAYRRGYRHGRSSTQHAPYRQGEDTL